MPLIYNTDNPDSLKILLAKAHTIKTVNQENLDFIQSRKVITSHQCNLQTKPSRNKKRKIQHDNNLNNELLKLKDSTSAKSINDIIESWRYNGEPLTKEKIAFDDFVDLKLDQFDDLIRLHDAYDRLLEKYSRVLSDEIESCEAVEILLRNLEVLQVAVGEIHGLTLDVVDTTQMSEAIDSFMKNISSELKILESKVPGLDINLRAEIIKRIENEEIVAFHDCDELKSMHKFSEHSDLILTSEPYMIDGKQYLASAGFDKKIKLWDLCNNTVVGTLTGHGNKIFGLNSFMNKGVRILASGSTDNTIRFWNLSNSTTGPILYEKGGICSMTIYENNGKNILVYGRGWYDIILRDLDTYGIITRLVGHEGFLTSLNVYYQESKPYLASGSVDRTIKIWDLNNHKIIKSLDVQSGIICDVVIVKDRGDTFLASGDENGCLTLWSLASYACIGTFRARSRWLSRLEVICYNGRVCLVYPGDNDTLKLWDLQSKISWPLSETIGKSQC